MNSDPKWHIAPLGDRAMIIECGGGSDEDVGAEVRGLDTALSNAALPGVVDIVPAFSTVAVHYRPVEVDDGSGRPAYESLRAWIEATLSRGWAAEATLTRIVEIPVCYEDAFGPDLQAVAAASGMTTDEVIWRHGDSLHAVRMIGFAPGFPYLGGLDPRLRMPRLPTPRAVVPMGSVGIAGEQTVIYSMETPGGWNLIGRTPLHLFRPSSRSPFLLRVGDEVRFLRISSEQYHSLEQVA